MFLSPNLGSPLAGDINWMETTDGSHEIYFHLRVSPLAGDINWMETTVTDFLVVFVIGPHSLGTLIEWKLQAYLCRCFCNRFFPSPLAGDINWMETCPTTPYLLIADQESPHSLGTLIEWKLLLIASPSFMVAIAWICPHSLGTLIEWKLFSNEISKKLFAFLSVPTRWGH